MKSEKLDIVISQAIKAGYRRNKDWIPWNGILEDHRDFFIGMVESAYTQGVVDSRGRKPSMRETAIIHGIDVSKIPDQQYQIDILTGKRVTDEWC